MRKNRMINVSEMILIDILNDIDKKARDIANLFIDSNEDDQTVVTTLQDYIVVK